MKLRGSSLRRRGELDPASGITNLADLMLVFSVAVMLMALTRWNVNLGGIPLEWLNPETLREVNGLETLEINNEGGGSGGQNNQVYIDNKTGQMFVLKPE